MSEEFENYKKTYSRVVAVSDAQEDDFYLQVYKSLYKNKYRNEVIFPVDNLQFRQIRDLRKLVGPKIGDVLERYFEMKNDWFDKQHRSLDCLIKNINLVNQSLQTTIKSRNIGKTATLQTKHHCNSCWVEYNFVEPIDYDFDKLTRCPECEKQNKQFKFVTKEERRAAIIKFGSMFLDMPEDGV